jgi:hypothetical protein
MSDYLNFQYHKAKTETARAKVGEAVNRVELAEIKERFAEIKSQHQPLDLIAKSGLSDRGKMYACAFYVVVGRLPDNLKGEIPE